MSETPVDLVKRLNKEFELALDALLIQSEATETTPVVYQTKEGTNESIYWTNHEDLNQHLNKFVATARQLEPFLISAKAQFTSDSNQDIRRVILVLNLFGLI